VVAEFKRDGILAADFTLDADDNDMSDARADV